MRRVPAAAVRDLRTRVLRPGQPTLVLPGDDDPATAHFAAYDGEHVVSVGSVRPAGAPFPVDGPVWQLRGMATEPGRRGEGLGAAVLDAVLGHLADSGGGVLWCNARVAARSLYARGGLVPRGEPWVDPAIGRHVVMTRPVPAR